MDSLIAGGGGGGPKYIDNQPQHSPPSPQQLEVLKPDGSQLSPLKAKKDHFSEGDLLFLGQPKACSTLEYKSSVPSHQQGQL